MLFKYKGYDNLGKKVSGNIEAGNLTIAKSKLKQKKIIYTKIEEGSVSVCKKYLLKPNIKSLLYNSQL